MDQLDRIIWTLGQQTSVFPIIVCFYTGAANPDFCAPMLREPSPPTETTFDELFPTLLVEALALNQSVHDGAVMIGRRTPLNPYRVTGWSYRLFPPHKVSNAEPNRGSAFNSCLAMSDIDTIDRMYLVSARGITTFKNGMAKKLAAT